MECHFTKGVDCTSAKPKCNKCGHNPDVSKERLEKRFQKPEKKPARKNLLTE